MKIKIGLLTLAIICSFTRLDSAFAQGTAFTYQGQLLTTNGPAHGTYNLQFSLYNVSSGGSAVYGPVTTNGVFVTNGLFEVFVDFGPGVFTGTIYWLQVGVETNGAASFTALSGRQEVTPTPYAIYAEGGNAAGLSGTIPNGDLSGTYGGLLTLNNAGNIFDGTFDGTFIGNGTGLAGVALLAGGNTFTGNQTIDGMLQISDGAGAGYHTDEVIGPGAYVSGEQHSVNFDDGAGHIGSLIVGWNGTDGYFSAGNLYTAGTHETGTMSFTVFGSGNVNIDPDNLNNGLLNNGNTNSSGLTFGSASGEGIASKRTAGGNQYGLDFYTAFADRMSIAQSGFIGIGTQTPVDGYTLFGVAQPANTNTWAGMWMQTGTGGRPFYGYSEGGDTLTWTERNGQNGDAWELYNYGYWLTVMPSGNVGIGTTTPSSALEVANGDVRLDGSRVLLYSGGDTNNGLGSGNLGLPGIFSGSGPFLFGFDGGALGAILPNTVCLSWDYSGDVWVSNNLSTASLTIRGGADLAEPFNISSGSGEIPQGAVVVIDEQNPGHLKLSDSPYDTRVAGVVSGANGVNPGIQMHQQGILEGGKNVALSGRVYVQADASTGAIRPGDMLTTSSTPGYAMKVSDHARAVGAILGKAMTGLSEGKGMVLVLVTLQ